MSTTTVTALEDYQTIITAIAVTNSAIQLIDHCMEKAERRRVTLYENLSTLDDQKDKALHSLEKSLTPSGNAIKEEALKHIDDTPSQPPNTFVDQSAQPKQESSPDDIKEKNLLMLA
jgi:hypothetical protein